MDNTPGYPATDSGRSDLDCSVQPGMADTPLADLAAEVGYPGMLVHLQEFARRVKLAGSPDELESFRYLKACLDGYGLRTELIFHDAYISIPGESRLEVGGVSPDCIKHSFSRPSPPGGLRDEVVYAASGTDADFAGLDVHGKIVVLENIANPTAALRSSEAGAIGQIHISPHRHLHEMWLSSVWGSPDTARLALLPRTTVVSLRRGDGDNLKRRVQAGEAVEAVLHAEVDTGWRRTPILQADLEAGLPDAEGAFVLFSGHHDTGTWTSWTTAAPTPPCWNWRAC